MKKQILIVFLSLLIFAGCDSGSQNTQVQDISEIQWQSDGMAMYGFIQSYIFSANSAQPANFIYDIAKFNADGSLAQTFTNSVKSRLFDPSNPNLTESYSPAIYLSADGSTIITQLEGDIYRFHTPTNSLDKLIQQLHLIVVSPNQRYVVGTNSPSDQPIKTLFLYDISVSPARIVKQFDLRLAPVLGIWLSPGLFGVTVTDTVGTFIAVFDTSGSLQMNIPGAGTNFHNAVYNAKMNDLFYLKHNGTAMPANYSVEKINLATSAVTSILNQSVESFDISNDEGVIIYTDSLNSAKNGYLMKIRNLQTSKEQILATDNFRLGIISPVADRVAYVRGDVSASTIFTQVKVIPFTRP